MQPLDTLATMGFTLPTPAYLFGAFFFSVVGFAAYRYGKRVANQPVRWIGAALMLYPYAIAQTWLLYAVGAGLCCAVWVYRHYKS